MQTSLQQVCPEHDATYEENVKQDPDMLQYT